MPVKPNFTDAGEMAAHYAAEEAPLCPECDCPLKMEYDWEKKQFYCPDCRADERNDDE
jgi:hypothetical protein